MKYIEDIKKYEEKLIFYQTFEVDATTKNKTEKKLKKLIEKLNDETDWIEIIGSFETFLNSVSDRQANLLDKMGSLDMAEFFKSELNKVFEDSKTYIQKEGQWSYCSEDNLNLVDRCQKQKIDYLKDCLLENGIDAHGPLSVREGNINDFEYFKVIGFNFRDKSITEEEKMTAKQAIAILYKLGIIDHLRTFESLKANDRALSRLLHVILNIGNKDTFQTYLSAERSSKHKSSAPQNNPLSKNLLGNAADKLEKVGLKHYEIQKYYPH